MTDNDQPPPKSPRSIVYRAWPGVLPPPVCDAVVRACDELPLAPSTIQRADAVTELVDPATRKADHVFIDPSHWCGSFVSHYAAEANQVWGLDITGLGTLSFVRYTESGHFAWHVDTLSYDRSSYRYPGDLERKLSVTINLTDPDVYEGGDLQFMNAVGQQVANGDIRQQGTVVVFPSTVAHRVSPLTKGQRDVLVGWLVGPPLR